MRRLLRHTLSSPRPREAVSLAGATRCTQDAASAASSAASTLTTPPPPPAPPVELCFFEAFLQQPKDYHLRMLTEAHRKHGVNLFVPPQLPPNGTPPEVPDVIFCDAQTERLRSIKLAYAPTHGPPPLETTGNRELQGMLAPSATAGSSSSPADSTAGASAAKPATMLGLLTKVRLPVEPGKKHHCSMCGKPFRVLLSAEHHVKNDHLDSEQAATVLDGPGPGELVDRTESPEERAAGAAAAEALKKKAAAAAEPVVDNAKANLTLPSAEEIDALLRDVWDPFGLVKDPKFVTAGSVVLGIADDRKPLTEDDLKPSARATPAGAAPGIKKVTPMSSTKQVNYKSIKELSARFPNPFGQSAHSAELAAIENEPKNPFLNLDPAADPMAAIEALRTGPGSPSLANAASSRRFACPACPKSFRILDGLIDHHEEAHGACLPDDVLAACRVLEKRGVFAKPVDPSLVVQKRQQQEAAGLAAAAPPSPVFEADVGVHFRCHSNAVLQGQVTEIQRGFLKTVCVTQLVVKAAADPDGAASSPTAAGAADEYVVIRCIGDSFSQLVTEQVKVGMTVLANGSLRMNRRLDGLSKRTHAYPYIAVTPPLGSVHVVDS